MVKEKCLHRWSVLTVRYCYYYNHCDSKHNSLWKWNKVPLSLYAMLVYVYFDRLWTCFEDNDINVGSYFELNCLRIIIAFVERCDKLFPILLIYHGDYPESKWHITGKRLHWESPMSSWSKFTGRKWSLKLKISVLPFLLSEKQELTTKNSGVYINKKKKIYSINQGTHSLDKVNWVIQPKYWKQRQITSTKSLNWRKVNNWKW